jgi:hypothetical protein
MQKLKVIIATTLFRSADREDPMECYSIFTSSDLGI